MSPILQEALRLAQLGIAIHWLVPPSSGGKAPIRRCWAVDPWQSPANLRAIYHAGYNVGIHTGHIPGARHHLVVLDIDDDDARRYADRKIPASPLAVVTCRGDQRYYRHPGAGIRVPTRQHIDGYALDLRGDGGQVVCPPSIHESGHQYFWDGEPSAAVLDSLPIWSPDWFPRAPAAAPVPTRGRSAPTAARMLRRAEARARHWPIAEESKGRGTQTFLLAAILVRELELDPQTAYLVMAAHYNPRLPQPYSEALLRRKIAEASRARSGPAATQLAVRA